MGLIVKTYYQIEALVERKWRRNFNKLDTVELADEWTAKLAGKPGIDDTRIVKVEEVEVLKTELKESIVIGT